MWIRMGTFAVKPEHVSSLRSTYNEVAIPKVRAFPGNLGCLLLEPAAADEPFDKPFDNPFVVLTIWSDRAAAEAYEASGGAAEVVGLVRAFFAGPPTLRSFESGSTAGLPQPHG